MSIHEIVFGYTNTPCKEIAQYWEVATFRLPFRYYREIAHGQDCRRAFAGRSNKVV